MCVLTDLQNALDNLKTKLKDFIIYRPDYAQFKDQIGKAKAVANS